MRLKFTISLLLIGAVTLLFGPSEGLTQFGPPGAGAPPGGGGPPGAGAGGGGRRQDGGGGGNPFGGGRPDPAQLFNMFSGGKDVAVRSDLDPRMQPWFDRVAQQIGVTNGQITREQFVANMQNQMAQWGGGGGRQRGGPPGAGGPGSQAGGGDSVDKMFRDADTNGDGFLNSDELSKFPGLKNDMARWDTNRDGKIDRNEFQAYMNNQNAKAQSTGQWPGDLPQEEDAPAKRQVVYTGSNLPKELDAVPWFKQLDTDHDGQVALYEWKTSGRPLDEFQKYDRNGDGFITIEEVLAYEAAHKPKAAPGQSTASAAGQPGFPGGGGPGGFGRGAFPGGPGGGFTPGAWPGGTGGGFNPGAFPGGGTNPGGRGNWNLRGMDGGGAPQDIGGGGRGGRGGRNRDGNGGGGDRGNRNRGGGQ